MIIEQLFKYIYTLPYESFNQKILYKFLRYIDCLYSENVKDSICWLSGYFDRFSNKYIDEIVEKVVNSMNIFLFKIN